MTDRKIKVLTLIGARPQFIKAAPLSRQLRSGFDEILVHSGQHFDPAMSESFFEELGIPEPNYNLGISGGSHGFQTGEILKKVERVIRDERPAATLVYGDTNTTLAGALASSKLGIPVIHVEAGLRSFDRQMPEEVNRVLTDHLSEILFTCSDTGTENLKHEGITSNVFNVGDIMLDTFRGVMERLKPPAESISPYAYLTLHRASNTDSKERLSQIFSSLGKIELPIMLPLHPRTKKMLKQFEIELPENIEILKPLPYLKNIEFARDAKVILTDSGGLQKEAFYLMTPCLTLRENTEWTETIELGWNRLVGNDLESLPLHLEEILTSTKREGDDVYGGGNAAAKILDQLKSYLSPK